MDPTKLSDFRDLWRKYGDLYTINIGQQTIVAVNGYETLREVFIKNGDKTSDRPNLYTIDVMLQKSGILTLFPYHFLKS